MTSTQITNEKRIFSGKQEEVRRQIENFWRIPSAAPDVLAYLHRDKAHKYAEGLGPWVEYETIFTKIKHRRLAENDEAFIIGLWHSFDVAQHEDSPGRGGISMIHLAGISKAPIFNAVSLNHTNVHLIDNMIELFKSSWKQHEFRREVVEHQLVRIENDRDRQLVTLSELNKSESEHLLERRIIEARFEIAKKHYEELKPMALKVQVDDFAFGLHLYPDHSVSHLHLHIVATPAELRKYSTFIHDKKTKDALEVRDIISNLPPGHPTNQIACDWEALASRSCFSS